MIATLMILSLSAKNGFDYALPKKLKRRDALGY